MTIETRYFRSDTWTVNSVTAGKLQTSALDSLSTAADSKVGSYTIYYGYDIRIAHSDGSETEIGTKVAVVSRSVNGEGIENATWSCPATSIVSTDAVRIIPYVKFGSGGAWENIDWFTTGWITEQLGDTLLSASTWTIYSYLKRYESGGTTNANLFWSSAVADMKITGFGLATAHTVTISETLGLSDGVTRKANFKQALTEKLGLTDTLTKKASFKQAISESLGLKDSVLAEKMGKVSDLFRRLVKKIESYG